MTLPVGLERLYFVGLAAPRGPQLPVYSAQARLIAKFLDRPGARATSRCRRSTRARRGPSRGSTSRATSGSATWTARTGASTASCAAAGRAPTRPRRARRATTWRSTDDRAARRQDRAHHRRRPRTGRSARPAPRREGAAVVSGDVLDAAGEAPPTPPGRRPRRQLPAPRRHRRRGWKAAVRRPRSAASASTSLVNNAGIVHVAPLSRRRTTAGTRHGGQRHRHLLRHAGRHPGDAPRRRRLDHQRGIIFGPVGASKASRLHGQQGRRHRHDEDRGARARRRGIRVNAICPGGVRRR